MTFNTYKDRTLVQMKIHANEQATEIARLRDQLRDCETSLNIFDEGRVSEYWMRHADQPSNE